MSPETELVNKEITTGPQNQGKTVPEKGTEENVTVTPETELVNEDITKGPQT